MLSELAIKNFAIIDDLRVSFKTGLSVITGETGAGKSMIISAVNLLLGSRASADLVRSGCDNAELEACFEITPDSHAWSIMKSQDMDPSEDLIVRRKVSSNGKSVVFINSRRSTLDLLKQVTANLAGISSQHAHQGLLKQENHLEILDAFSKKELERASVNRLYRHLEPLKKEQQQLIERLEKQQKEQELVAFQVNEIDSAAIEPGEDEVLEKKRSLLMNAAQIFETVNGTIHDTHDCEGSVIERLSHFKNDLLRVGSDHDQIETVCQRMSSVIFDLQDIVSELRTVSDTIDLDPASLEAVDQRLDLISRLKRKYGPTLDDLFENLNGMQQKLDQTITLKKQIDDNEKKIKDLQIQLSKEAVALSEARKQAAKQLALEASEQLAALEMSKARFDIKFEHKTSKNPDTIKTEDGIKIGPSGIDHIHFLLSPNPGEPLKPLAKIASGGELSRVVLALKAVLSKTQSLETLIFDEVDAGIGGATSEKVGSKLRQLSADHQVICITHLAQIAKYGHAHFRIDKNVVDGRTCTRIVSLNNVETRVEEIARMIGGSNISKATRTHAKELLAQAASTS